MFGSEASCIRYLNNLLEARSAGKHLVRLRKGPIITFMIKSVANHGEVGLLMCWHNSSTISI